MENGPLIDDFPIKTSIDRGLSSQPRYQSSLAAPRNIAKHPEVWPPGFGPFLQTAFDVVRHWLDAILRRRFGCDPSTLLGHRFCRLPAFAVCPPLKTAMELLGKSSKKCYMIYISSLNSYITYVNLLSYESCVKLPELSNSNMWRPLPEISEEILPRHHAPKVPLRRLNTA